MPDIAPRAPGNALESAALCDAAERAVGFVRDSLPTMARRPEILAVYAALFGAVMVGAPSILGFRQLVALMASTPADCRSCQARTAAT